MKLKDKVAVITGGNSGIGLSIAQEFKAEGAKVAILGRNKTTLEAAAQALGEGTVVVQGDVTQSADIEKLYRETVEAFGKIDVLVANAGVAKPRPCTEVDEANFDETADINFKGTFFTVQGAIPHLKKGASVILIGSIAGQIGHPGMSVYSATKAAIRSLARSFSAELLPMGIRVNNLSPGPIKTPIFDKMGLSKEEIDAFGSQIMTQVPMARFGESHEMAKAALFLASSDSSFVAGIDLVADGGMSQI
ncbi:MAG: glucose 1-dehydrogenase [Nitrospirae bacterium]|nr:glucose 1-dehydrogenase [Candidatus Manganitrophaceae bacterium]